MTTQHLYRELAGESVDQFQVTRGDIVQIIGMAIDEFSKIMDIKFAKVYSKCDELHAHFDAAQDIDDDWDDLD